MGVFSGRSGARYPLFMALWFYSAEDLAGLVVAKLRDFYAESRDLVVVFVRW